MKHRALKHGLGQVEAKATVAKKLDRQCRNATAGFKANIKAPEEWVPFARDRKIAQAVEAHADGPPGLLRRNGRNRCEEVGLNFLSTEGATHSDGLTNDLMLLKSENPCDDFLRFCRMLRRSMHDELPIFVAVSNRRLGFEIKVLLAAYEELAGNSLLRFAKRLVHIASVDS